MHALLMAQEPDEAGVLTVVLQRAGLAVSRAGSLERVLQTGPEHPVDLVMLVSSRHPTSSDPSFPRPNAGPFGADCRFDRRGDPCRAIGGRGRHGGRSPVQRAAAHRPGPCPS